LVPFESKSGQFVPYLGGISAQDMDVSKDGEWVTYVSYLEGVLSRSRVDGNQRLQLTSLPMQVSYLAGRPMGNELLFRLRFLEDRAKFTWLRQTAAGPRSSRQGIITRLTRTGHQTKTLVFGGVPWLEGGAAGSAVIHMLDLSACAGYQAALRR
jgi:hypothetical protein